VERYRVDEFVFTPMQCCNKNNISSSSQDPEQSNTISSCVCDSKQQIKSHSLWNCDGELLYQPTVRVSVHRNLIRIMGRTSTETKNYLSLIMSSNGLELDDISTCPTVSTTVMTRSPSLEVETIGSSTVAIDRFQTSPKTNAMPLL
jgi:hypothetical protein